MKLIIVSDVQDFPTQITPDTYMISINTGSGHITGRTVHRAYLVGFDEQALREFNPHLYDAIKVAMISSEGQFVS